MSQPNADPNAKKKKISRLIPAEEALAPIEEATERSEDSSIISEANNNEKGKKSPYRASKEGIATLATETISEAVASPPLVVVAGGTPQPEPLPDSQVPGPETADGGGSQQQPPSAAPTPPAAPQNAPNKSQQQPLQNTNNQRPPPKKGPPPQQQEQQPGNNRTAEKGGSQQPPTASTSAAAPQHQPNKPQQQPPQVTSPSPSPSGPGNGNGSNHRRSNLPEQGGNKKAPVKEKKDQRQRPQHTKSGRPPQPGGKPPEHGKGAAPQQPNSGAGTNSNIKKGGSESSNDTATTEKMTDGEDEEDTSMHQREIKQQRQKRRGSIHKDKDNNNNSSKESLSDQASSGSLQSSIASMGGGAEEGILGGGTDDEEGDGDGEGLFDFDDDYDDSMFQSEKEEVLTWRLDPSESLSDWTLKVKSRDIDKVDTYHVHKNILAVGQRKSEYFANVFRMAGRGEAKNNLTEVEMGSAAAKVIPVFLDFMYSTDGDLDIKTSTATGLRYLAQFFGVRVLHKSVMDFIQRDMSLTTCTTYYKDVCAVRDEKLLLTIAKFCSRNILKIDSKSPLVGAMDSFFLAKVMSSPLVNSKEKKYYCSVLLAEYCQTNREMIDDKQFLMLTDDKVLPVVHQSVALTLLEMEADFVVATTLSGLLEMSSLQKRCVKELSQNWRDLTDETEQVTRICRKLPSSVVTDLLIRCLNQAKRKSAEGEDIDSSKHKKEKGKKDKDAGKASPKPNPEVILVKREFELKLDKLKQEHLDELATLKREYENNLVRLRDMLVEKDKTISKFWHEIKSFERLPNGHDGKLVSSGKNHEASFMPEVGKIPPDGILLTSKKKDGPKFPVFYYKKDDRSASESASK